jgi:hypothetical protein
VDARKEEEERSLAFLADRVGVAAGVESRSAARASGVGTFPEGDRRRAVAGLGA